MLYNLRKHQVEVLLASLGILHLITGAKIPNPKARRSPDLPKRFYHGRIGTVTPPEKQSPKKLAKKESQWTKASDLRGQALVDFFDFETENTSSQGGLVQYVSTEDAFKENLLQIQDDTVYFKVDQTQQVQGLRKSIRVSSKTTFSPGSLLIIDVKHMPVACGAWPAIWTVAKDGSWPAKGEIDIVEGVNLFTHNSYSAHTKDGFVMHPHGFTSEFMLDADHQNNCGVDATDNQGCGLRDRSSDAFGEPFNSAGGGVFILDWADRAIWINFYPRNEIPDHIRNGNWKLFSRPCASDQHQFVRKVA